MTRATVQQGQAHSSMHGLGTRAGMGLTGKTLKVLGCRVGVMLREQ